MNRVSCPPRLTRRSSFAIVVLLLASSVGLGGESTSHDFQLRVPPVVGAPGEEVVVEFRVTFSTPLLAAMIGFDVADGVAEFIGTTIAGTVSAHAAPRGVVYNPEFYRGGFLTGVRLDTQPRYGSVDPGDDVVLVKAILRVRADAGPGEYAVRVFLVDATTSDALAFIVTSVEDGVLRVTSPVGPRPLQDLGCRQVGTEAFLGWKLTESYDMIHVERRAERIATLDGLRTNFRDVPTPGPLDYRVVASRGGVESLPVTCELLFHAPRPPAVVGLDCTQTNGSVDLRWENGGVYDSISVLRNGDLLTELDGSSTTHADFWSSDLFTVYTVKAHIDADDSLPVSCTINEMSDTFIFWAEEVHAEPGMRNVPIRIFATNPRVVEGYQIGLRIDPALARIQELTVSGTATEAAGYEKFLYQQHVLDSGETGTGISFPYENQFPAGADQHIVTVLVDIPADVPSGTVATVDLDGFGSPRTWDLFTINGESQDSESRDGAILIGQSPVPPVAALLAGLDDGPVNRAGGGDAAVDSTDIRLRWTNVAHYSAIRIERDELVLEEIPGDREFHVDRHPGPGLHRYRVIARDGNVESFPAVAVAYPRGIPGVFLRGDANADDRINITDVVNVLQYLFLGGLEPTCLDAGDADDNGTLNLTDPVTILYFLFRGAGPLPLPGTEVAWFDPTEDELTCQ